MPQSIRDLLNFDSRPNQIQGDFLCLLFMLRMDDDPILICAGNVNAVKLKYFVLNAGHNSNMSYIVCKHRDLSVLQKVTEGYPIKVLTID